MEGSRKRATDGEVDGGKATGGHNKVKKSRTDQHELRCQPCHEEGKHREARWYCQDCGEYLCQECFQIHPRVKLTRNHVLLNIADMAGAGATSNKAGDGDSGEDDTVMAIIDRLVDDAEKKYLDHVDAITHDVCKLSRDYIDRITSVRTNISDKAKTGRDNKLVPLLKEADTLIAECKTLTSRVQHKCNVKPCVFVGNETLLDHLHSVGAIGQLVTETFPYLSDDINIRGPTDGDTCDVSCLLLLADGRLLLSDWCNKNIKLFDDNHTLVSHVPLQFSPTDIAETAGGLVAVCMPLNKTIQFVSVSGTLTPGRVIQTAVPCHSVTRCGDNLAAVYYSSRDIVEINMTGRKVTTVWTCPDGELRYIRHNTHGELITTDNGGGVTRVTRDGVMRARYKGDNLAAPHGLTVHPDGSIYICGYKSGNIHHITADCTRIEVFGDGRLSQPYNICYNQHDNCLYVSQDLMGDNECIKVFRLGH